MEVFKIRYHHLRILMMLCAYMFIKCCVHTATTEVVVKRIDDEADIRVTIAQRNTTREKYNNLLKQIKMRTKTLYERRKRSSTHIKGSCRGLCERSLCPWNITLHRDPDRIPENIGEAKCLTRKCHFPYTSIKLELLTICEEIKEDILVYKDNKYTLERNWPIACACMERNASRRNVTATNGSQRTVGKKLKKRHLKGKNTLRKLNRRKIRLLNKKRHRKGLTNSPRLYGM